MNPTWISRFPWRRPVLAGLATSIAAWLAAAGTALGAPTQYSIINLAAEAFPAYLNERSEAAFNSFVYNKQGFFDGDRLYDIPSLGGGGFLVVNALNNNGVVVGYSEDSAQPFSPIYGFRWTRAGGTRAIPGSLGGTANDVNDNDQAVGERAVAGVVAGSATRYDPDGRVVALPPPVRSSARAINNAALAGGELFAADDTIHAAIWGGGSRLVDLGTLGPGGSAYVQFVNERGDAAGSAGVADDIVQGFFWNARSGTVLTGARGFPTRLTADLNEQGEIVGVVDLPGGAGAAYLWSRTRGLALLPRGGAVRSDVYDVNNKTQMVGLLGNANNVTRAVRWDGVAAPVDLNTLLVRPPAGLVLDAAVAINDAGTILASSNAGLVMLRPGTRGTDAPVLGPVFGLPDFPVLGQDVNLTLGFVDNDPAQTHTVDVQWFDGCPTPAPVLTESGGVGNIVIRHRFCQANSNLVIIRVTDSAGRSTETRRQFYIEPAGVAALQGSGTLAWMQPGAAARAPLQFMLWAPVGTAAATQPLVAFDGPFRFRAEQVGTATRHGRNVRLEGTGRLNGRSGYRFLVDALDGGGQQADGDRLRVRIVHVDGAGTEVVDYDNGVSARAPTAAASVGTAANTAANTADTARLAKGDIVLKL